MNIFQRLYISRRLSNQFYRFSREDLSTHQTAAWQNLWGFVYEHSSYYQRYTATTPHAAIDPCSRSEMMAHFNTINTAGLDRDTLVAFRIEKEKTGRMDYFEGGYSIGLSSGTTGSRLLTVLSKRERDLYTSLLWARNGLPAGIRPLRVLFALRTFNPAFTEISVFGVRMVYVDYTQSAEALVALINQKQLNILAGPPSLLLMIAQNRDSIPHQIAALVSYAEVLDDAAKVRLEQAFGAPVVQIYQGAEGFIGSTCRHGQLHINEDILLVEPLTDPAQGPVKVMLTDLYRRTQPLIRYQLDDLLELDNGPCPCGSCFRRITRIHGRADDVLIFMDQAGRPCYLFPDYVRRAINQASDQIVDYQAIQHRPGFLEIRLLLSDERERGQIEQTILANLAWRVEKIGAALGEVVFSSEAPEKNPQSLKLIRINRAYPWNL